MPTKLQRQVNEYFAYLWTCMRGLGESDVMGSLPTSLRRQLAIALNRKLFLKVELFRKCDASTILALAERLAPSIAVPKEYVLRQGEPVTALYFISRGRVLVLVRTDATSAAASTTSSCRTSVTNTTATTAAAGSVDAAAEAAKSSASGHKPFLRGQSWSMSMSLSLIHI